MTCGQSIDSSDALCECGQATPWKLLEGDDARYLVEADKGGDFGGLDDLKQKDVVIQIRTSIPTDPGCLFECGGAGMGTFVGIVSQPSGALQFRFSAGDGAQVGDTSDMNTAVIAITLPDPRLPQNGTMHNLTMTVQPAKHTITLFVDDVLVATASSTGDFNFGHPKAPEFSWAGGNACGAGVGNGGIAVGGDPSPWQGVFDGRLQVIGVAIPSTSFSTSAEWLASIKWLASGSSTVATWLASTNAMVSWGVDELEDRWWQSDVDWYSTEEPPDGICVAYHPGHGLYDMPCDYELEQHGGRFLCEDGAEAQHPLLQNAQRPGMCETCPSCPDGEFRRECPGLVSARPFRTEIRASIGSPGHCEKCAPGTYRSSASPSIDRCESCGRYSISSAGSSSRDDCSCIEGYQNVSGSCELSPDTVHVSINPATSCSAGMLDMFMNSTLDHHSSVTLSSDVMATFLGSDAPLSKAPLFNMLPACPNNQSSHQSADQQVSTALGSAVGALTPTLMKCGLFNEPAACSAVQVPVQETYVHA